MTIRIVARRGLGSAFWLAVALGWALAALGVGLVLEAVEEILDHLGVGVEICREVLRCPACGDRFLVVLDRDALHLQPRAGEGGHHILLSGVSPSPVDAARNDRHEVAIVADDHPPLGLGRIDRRIDADDGAAAHVELVRVAPAEHRDDARGQDCHAHYWPHGLCSGI